MSVSNPTPRPPWRHALLSVFTAGLSLLACGPDPVDPADYAVIAAPAPEPPPACAHREPLRRAFFGDLHVHTALSMDAWNYDLDLRPADAYAYAFGEAVRLPPRDARGRGTREVRIDRPLDFTAVTDHAEFLGETTLCGDPDSEVYESETCVAVRASTGPMDSPVLLKIVTPWPSRHEDVCGEGGARCDREMRSAWRETIEAAEAWNDTSTACTRSTFVGFEYSSNRLGANLHRNVIFRSAAVPARPISYLEVPREWDLWQLLRDVCIDAGAGCDALAIPHNSNISNGRMFAVDYAGAGSFDEQVARAALRQSLEPVVEIMQHKGDSECRVEMPGVLGAPDEFCAFEKFEDFIHPDEEGGEVGACWEAFADWVPHLGPDCLSYRSYARYALIEGLAEERRLGVNPFKFGLMASTDTHNALAGGVQERNSPGHLGVADAALDTRLAADPGVMGSVGNNPGGLIGVWAEENRRGALFDAIRRREVFGTSGPRIEPRLFGGWGYPADLCEDANLLAVADRAGVPMGGDLPPSGGVGPPVFVALARADPGTAEFPGGALQRIQVVKGWVGEDGALRQRVFDVAGGDNGAWVEAETCAPRGPGAQQLCGVWRDPDFDPARRAVYYARVLENPSCRHSAWQCLELPADQRPSGCAHAVMQRIQQERAWTSPIWYTPPAG